MILLLPKGQLSYHITVPANEQSTKRFSSAGTVTVLLRGKCLELLTHVDGQVHEAAGVTPLVVVPGHNLHLVANYAGQLRIEDRGGRVGDDVTRNDRVLGVLQDALERALCGFLDGGVDGLNGYVLAGREGQVGGGTGGYGHAHCEAVELALQSRQNQRYSLGCTGGGRNDVGGRGTSATQVLVGAIQQVLVGGVGVNRGHETAFNANYLVENLGHWGEAARGARCVRHYVVIGRVVVSVVYTDDEGGVFVLTRGRNDDLLGASFNVGLGLLSVDETAGGFDHDVNIEFAPGQFGRIGLSGCTERAAAHSDGVIGVGDILCQTTQDGVVLQQMSQSLVVSEVVNAYNLNISTGFQNGPVEVASDTAETVNTNANCHFSPPRHTPEVAGALANVVVASVFCVHRSTRLRS